MSELNGKIIKATKWSTITELAAKLVSPISTMILARLLTPEAFGVMVTATMVISFAEVFTDAGFQKYLIQHKFNSRKELYASTNVAFWSNLVMSLVIWIIIVIFCQPIATLVGNSGRGDVIAVSCSCIPLAAFSSIQMALYKRDLDFKTLFIVRMVGVVLPIVVTVPLAWLTHSYWSLIIGMIALNLSNAFVLTIKSKWKPKFEYNFQLLQIMFGFTAWSMLEALALWTTSYADIFIVGTMLSQTDLGYYRTSISTVGQIMALITSATTPILFSGLSKLQDDSMELKKLFFKFQKIVALLVFPLGVGMFVFRDIFVELFLGPQWHKAAYFIGIWGLTSTITIVLSHYSSEMFRAKGKPKISFISQVIHIAVLIPVVLWSVKYGYNFLCTMRTLVRFPLILINLIFLYYLVHISPWKMLKNISIPMFGGIIMACFGIGLLKISTIMICQLIWCVICSIIYIGYLICFSSQRKILHNLKKSFMK